MRLPGTSRSRVVLCAVVPNRFRSSLTRSIVLLCLVVCSACAAESTGERPVLDVRSFGAIGDGKLHRVAEWIEAGRFRNLAAVKREYPFVDDAAWSIDEIAFAAAKHALPEIGGVIRFPAGHYVSGKYPWRIWRDHVQIVGDGAERTILSTAPEVEEGLSLAPYRHVGWLDGADRACLFRADSGARGETSLQLVNAARAAEFQPGDLVFVRNGANRFDQDYGEFNEVAGTSADGRVQLKHPLARDYTLARLNWANETTRDFALPRAGAGVTVSVRSGEGYFQPSRGTTISIGENLFRVDKSSAHSLRLINYGRDNAPPGTVIPAGTKIGKGRSLIKLTRSTRDFRCENLKIIGRRKTLNLSNSYDSVFVDCVFVRDLRDGSFKGGLTIDGDGGRFARFERCAVIALPTAGMQFARSFGGVTFGECTFTDTNVAFTEFNFECEVARCTFTVSHGRGLGAVVIAGGSCGELRFWDNRISAVDVPALFDRVLDIHSQKHGSDGGHVAIRGNRIETTNVPRVFPGRASDQLELADNVVVRH